MELGNGVTIDFTEIAQNNPGLLRAAVAEIAEAAAAENITDIPQFAGANAVGAALEAETGSEATTTATDIEAEPPKIEVSVFDTLTPEKQERARKETAALAEKYDRPVSDFSVISYVNEAGKEVICVALTATEGHDLGDPAKTWDPKRNWDETLKQQKDGQFVIEVDGEPIDSLEDVDGSYLEAVAAANPEIYEWGWRVGEKDKADRDVAPVAGLCGGRVDLGRSVRSFGNSRVRVRPRSGDLN
jgi:hypothetical protein